MFYVISSGSPYVYCFKTDKFSDRIVLHFVKKLDFLDNSYTRAIRIIEDKMYFVSGNKKIVVTTYRDEEFSIISEYPVQSELAGMNDIYKNGDWFFITATPQKIVCTQDLNDLNDGKCIDIYEKYGFRGTPYYFSDFDGYTYLTEITEYSGILRFKIKNGNFFDFERLHDFGKPSVESIERKNMYKV
jgi:hypothetical protein